MGTKRHDDRGFGIGDRASTPGGEREARREAERAFERDEDMGGSRWSGASGRGGIHQEGTSYAASNRGYGSERGRAGELLDGSEHGHEGGFPGDRRSAGGEEGAAYPRERRFSHDVSEAGARLAPEGREDTGFLREEGFGHIPGQRWSGGYGGDRDRDRPSSEAVGLGFNSNDFRGGVASGASHGQDRRGRGPHWGKGPKGYTRPDDRTREDVLEVIVHQAQIDASDVDVRVEDSIVILTGTVVAQEHMLVLEQLVQRALGVRGVRNGLRLRKSSSDRASSGDLRGRRGNGSPS